MARKETKEAAHQTRGVNDIVGFVLIAAAVLLLLAQFSFDRHDVAANQFPPNQTAHNWIGKAGAYGAYGFFFLFGAGAFVLPILMLVFALGCLTKFFSYLRRRWVWAFVLFCACIGFFDLYSSTWENLRQNLNAPSAGGMVGHLLNELFFGLFGKPGATIIFITLYVVSLVYLTNFRLTEWVRSVMGWRAKHLEELEEGQEGEDWTEEERALARRARELERQARKLQVQAEKTGGIGADLQPVPTPTVRDLSIAQPRPNGKNGKQKTHDPEDIKEGLDGEVIPAHEVAAATTEEILGKHAAKDADNGKADAADGEPKPEDEVPNVVDNSVARKRPAHKRKPLTVASAPAIGNYQLPTIDFLQLPDTTVKPTESKEELMANARLMQNTLAQFDIEVSLGDITKGPTITRYELHPAPGVKLERITGLTNNIAAALKAERINMLAPCSRQKLRRSRGPQPNQDQGHHARPARIRGMAENQGADTPGPRQGRVWAADYCGPCRNAPPADRGQHRLRQIRLH